MEFSKGYAYSGKDPGGGTGRSDAMHVVIPLLGFVLLIIIALFIIWRCQLQKTTRHWPSYGQSRYLATRTGCSLPRVMVYREASHNQGDSHGQREVSSSGGSSSRGPTDGWRREAGPGGLGDNTLRPPVESPVLFLSRLSSATPPPSYEEVTGHPKSSSNGGGTSSNEESSVSYSDPPPKYEIVAATSAPGK